ncbi:MAG: glycosyltransferase family 9 protein [Ktedonobacteraceae bacterium]
MPTKQIHLPPDARILVVKLATIGDLLLATPALRALRETYPHARLDLLVTPASAGLLDDWDVIDRVIVLDKYLFDYPQQLLKTLATCFDSNHSGTTCAMAIMMQCCSFII